MRHFLPIFVLLAIVCAGCNNNKTDTTSPYAEVTAFSFATDTANPGLAAATYKVEQRTDTGYIYNRDSLVFGTSLARVIPTISYKATPASATFVLPDTTIIYSGADTLDFSKQPIYLHVKSSDLQNEKWYMLSFTVHQVDPDLYVWDRLTPQIFKPQMCEQKVFIVGQELVLFVNNGFHTQLFLSREGITWSESTAPTGLPAQCRVRDILQLGSTLYYADGDNLYMSTDLYNWTSIDCSANTFSLVNMLVAFDNRAWCILSDRTSERLLLGYVQGERVVPADSVYGLDGNWLPNDFPVSDFASLSFAASSERPRAMVVGGRTQDGTMLNTRWNLEYEASQGYRIKNFSIEQPDFHSLTGVSIIQYDNHLVMFGGIDNDSQWRTSMLFSDDEGMHWYTPDTAHNRLPDDYGQRQKQTAVVDARNNIYLIGGQSFTETYSDVYRGYLTSIDW